MFIGLCKSSRGGNSFWHGWIQLRKQVHWEYVSPLSSTICCGLILKQTLPSGGKIAIKRLQAKILQFY